MRRMGIRRRSSSPTHDMPEINMCDIWNPDDCPEGEKCTAYATMGSSWDANKCVPVMGDKQFLEPCMAFGDNPGVSGLDDCAKGSMCWDVGQDATGYCVEFCKGAPNDPSCPGWVSLCHLLQRCPSAVFSDVRSPHAGQ